MKYTHAVVETGEVEIRVEANNEFPVLPVAAVADAASKGGVINVVGVGRGGDDVGS
jgi:hypothetical protein